MRSLFALMMILSLATAGLVFELSNFDDAVSGPNPGESLDSTDELQQQANESQVQQGFNGSAKGADEGDIVGVILRGVDAIFKYAGMIVLLPLELNSMGFPWYLAYPGGLFLQVVASIGLVQFATNRNWI